jgi:hypothetical protein
VVVKCSGGCGEQRNAIGVVGWICQGCLDARPLAIVPSVWIAYYADRSAAAVFATEIEALRFALRNTMSVKLVTLPCEDVFAETPRA